MAYNAEKLSSIDLGRQGENLARTVEIDVSSYLEKWPGAEIALLVKRKNDANPYIADTHIEDGILYWPITAADTEMAGDGKIELRVICGNVLAKSATGSIRVVASLTGIEGETPEPAQSWVNQVLEASRQAAQSADQAKHTADSLAGISADAVTLEPGEQATVEQKDGVMIYGIPRGLPGQNGISPTIELSKSGKETTLKVTDVSGTKTVVIMDGENATDDGASALYAFLTSEDMVTGTADKTYADMVAAVESGKSVYMVMDNMILPMVGVSEGACIFLLSLPGSGYALIQYDTNNNATIEFKVPSAITTGGTLAVTLNDDMTTDKSYEEVLSALEAGNSVYMIYPMGSSGFIFLSPAYVSSDSSVLFAGQFAGIEFTVTMLSDGTVNADSNLFDHFTTVNLSYDEASDTFWIPGQWNDTAIIDEIAVGRFMALNYAGVGLLPYAGSNFDPVGNNTVPIFSTSYWDSSNETMELIQARVSAVTFVDPKSGEYGLKVDLIRWKIAGERIIS